ncbi:TPA: hypothetical protein ACH3X2_013837 [Trebouxia sp. C0005]
MAKGIGDQEARLPGQPLGHTLRELESHSLKSCDHEKGRCGVRNRVQHCLVSHPPKVFTMQLAWQTDSESKLDIKAAMMGLREGLDLADVYLGIAHGCFLYHIRSVVCYYGQHYIAFVLMSDSLWYMFDDARILCIGLWADVINRNAMAVPMAFDVLSRLLDADAGARERQASSFELLTVEDGSCLRHDPDAAVVVTEVCQLFVSDCSAADTAFVAYSLWSSGHSLWSLARWTQPLDLSCGAEDTALWSFAQVDTCLEVWTR